MKKSIIGVVLIATLFSGCNAKTTIPEGANVGGSGGGSVSVSVDKPEEKKSDFKSDEVLNSLTTTTYTWNSEYDNCLALVVKNNSTIDCELSVDVSFKNSEGKLIGAKDRKVEAFGAGGEICLVFDNEEAFSDYEYKYSVSEIEYYKAVDSAFSCEATPAKDKVIVSVTNNGEEKIDSANCTVLFLKGENVIDSNVGYFGFEGIEPGKAKTDEVLCFDDFDNAKVFMSGYSRNY